MLSISYPNSKWDNIRNNMGQGVGTTTSSIPSSTSSSTSTSTSSTQTTTSSPTTTTTSTTSTTTSAPTSTPTSGSCGSVAAWDSTVSFRISWNLSFILYWLISCSRLHTLVVNRLHTVSSSPKSEVGFREFPLIWYNLLLLQTDISGPRSGGLRLIPPEEQVCSNIFFPPGSRILMKFYAVIKLMFGLTMDHAL